MDCSRHPTVPAAIVSSNRFAPRGLLCGIAAIVSPYYGHGFVAENGLAAGGFSAESSLASVESDYVCAG
jgi:hypothetical protein